MHVQAAFRKVQTQGFFIPLLPMKQFLIAITLHELIKGHITTKGYIPYKKTQTEECLVEANKMLVSRK